MLSVTNVVYLESYNLKLTFNNGVEGIANLHDAIFNDHRMIFSELRDKNEFQKFKIAHCTVVWDNGLDLAPEFLLELATKNN